MSLFQKNFSFRITTFVIGIGLVIFCQQCSLYHELMQLHPDHTIHLESFARIQGSLVQKNDVLGGHIQQQSKELMGHFKRPCRVIIENAIDYHHEIIESVVKRFPLPWHDFNCSTEFPVIYDFSLFQNRYPDRVPFYIGKKPNHLNETEFWGWKTYFEQNLQNQIITRATKDGTLAYYHKFLDDEEYNEIILKQNTKAHDVDAIIDISCGIDFAFIKALKLHNERYCVLHGEVPDLDNTVKNKTCWLSPMYPPGYCTFMPTDLPTVRLTHAKNDKQSSIHVCAVGGGGRDHSKIVKMFSSTPYEKYNVTMTLNARRIQARAQNLAFKLGLDKHIKFTYVRDFVDFAAFVSGCDIYLPCTDPKERRAHFPWGTKSLTGSIPQIIAYNLPSVMHSDLEAIYHNFFTAPVEVYTNETNSDIYALTRMIKRIAYDRTTNISKTVIHS